MRSRDEGIETVFASYANMTEEKKQKFTQVTAAITSGLPPMSACFNDRLDGANGTHRHKDRGLDLAVVGRDESGTGICAAGCGYELIVHSIICSKKHAKVVIV